MSATFSSPSKVVTVTATIDTSDHPVNEWQVRDALTRLARDEGVVVQDLSVSIVDGERLVTITESEYVALRQGQSGAAAPAE
jgi:hypothetical protein